MSIVLHAVPESEEGKRSAGWLTAFVMCWLVFLKLHSLMFDQLTGDETCVVFSEFCRALSLTPRAKVVATQIARLFHICVRAWARSECQGAGSRLRGFDPYLRKVATVLSLCTNALPQDFHERYSNCLQTSQIQFAQGNGYASVTAKSAAPSRQDVQRTDIFSLDSYLNST